MFFAVFCCFLSVFLVFMLMFTVSLSVFYQAFVCLYTVMRLVSIWTCETVINLEEFREFRGCRAQLEYSFLFSITLCVYLFMSC